MKLLTGFEAFGPHVKDFALGVNVVVLDGASVVLVFKGVGVSYCSVSSIQMMFQNLT